jgi:hypothetical protein
MNRIIKDYHPVDHGITKEFLYDSNDWDLIELNYKINFIELQRWWDEVEEKFPQMKFNFNENSDLIKLDLSEQMVEEGYCGYYCGPIDGFTLAWPEERYESLPPPVQACPIKFPEVNYDTFINDAKILNKINFGYFKHLLKELGEDSFKQAIVTIHHPGMYIKQHIDSKLLKLHVPIYSNPDSYFHFGKNKERKYHMKPGRAFILNTGNWHGTTNETPDFRSHIITRVTKDHILTLIGMTNE